MTEEDLAAHRDAALQGICPLCGVGGWESLAHHVARKHGVLARELKRRLGLPYSASLTSAEVHERASEIRSELGAPPALIEASRTSSRARHIGRAGARARREGARRAAAVHAAQTRKIPAEAVPALAARIERGERHKDVAAEFGANAATLWRAIKRWRERQGQEH